MTQMELFSIILKILVLIKKSHYCLSLPPKKLTYADYSGFNLTTCDSYFMILVEVFVNHILVENICSMKPIE